MRKGLALLGVRGLSAVIFELGIRNSELSKKPGEAPEMLPTRFNGKSICKSKLQELRAPSLLERVTREHPTSLATGGSAWQRRAARLLPTCRSEPIQSLKLSPFPEPQRGPETRRREGARPCLRRQIPSLKAPRVLIWTARLPGASPSTVSRFTTNALPAYHPSRREINKRASNRGRCGKGTRRKV